MTSFESYISAAPVIPDDVSPHVARAPRSWWQARPLTGRFGYEKAALFPSISPVL